MPEEFATLDDALAHYWDLMLADPAATLEGVETLLLNTSTSHERYSHIEFYHACCFIYLGQLAQAEFHLKNLNTKAIEGGDLQQQRRVLNALGMVLKSLGRFAEAAQTLEKSAELCQALNMPEAELPVRLNLANLFMELDDRITAQQQMETMAGLLVNDISDEWSGEIEFVKARLLLAEFDFTAAHEALRNALSIAEKLGYNHLRVNSLTILGRVQRLQGDISTATATLKTALSDPDFENEGVLGVTAYIELVKALISAEEYTNATEFLNTAQLVLSRESNAKYQSQVSELRAIVSFHEGDYKTAYEALEESSRLRQSLSSELVQQAVAIERYQREKSVLQAERQLTQRENELLKATQQKLEVINEFARELAATRDIDELGHAVFRLMKKHLKAHMIAIATNDEAHRCLTYNAIVENDISLPLYCLSYDVSNSRMIQTVKGAKPLVFHEKDPLVVGGDPKLMPRSQLYLPLILNDEVMGVLSSQTTLENYYQGESLDLIIAIAPFLTLAVDNARSHEHVFQLNKQLREEKFFIEQAQSRIQHLANHDMLTDLPNRRALEEKLDEAFESHQVFSFAYIDLDGFKPINDQYGHPVGDAVLKVISQRLRNVLRKSDFAARIGGDEFVLILFQERAEQELKVAMERILDTIRQPISIDQKILQVSASIGVVNQGFTIRNRTDLLHYSDQAMYEAKRRGNGGVYFYDETA